MSCVAIIGLGVLGVIAFVLLYFFIGFGCAMIGILSKKPLKKVKDFLDKMENRING